MIQLNPTIPFDTPKGKGFAHFVIDYGQEHNLLWVVFLNESGECWTFSNQLVRLDKNETLGIRVQSGTEIAKEKTGPLPSHNGSFPLPLQPVFEPNWKC